MKNACEGVLYPKDALCAVRSAMEEKAKADKSHNETEGTTGGMLQKSIQKGNPITVPHRAWVKCKDELDSLFWELKRGIDDDDPTKRPTTKRVFVLAPLHKGSLIGRPFLVYTPHSGTLSGTDWSIALQTPDEILELGFVEENDDICTEEHSLEMIAPYLANTYPNTPVCYLLAPCKDEKICELKHIIGHFRSNSIIFVSNDEITQCASMWL